MRVILLHQYYKTPEEGGGIRSWYLCRALKEAGHEVEVVTAWNKKESKTVLIDGYPVHYLSIHYSNDLGFFRRIWSFTAFFIAAYKKVNSLSRPDFIYAISTPLSIGALAKWIRWRKSIPYFFEVGDLWPDVPAQMGYLLNPLLIRILKSLELSIYKSAKGIVAMSPAMVDCFNDLGYGSKTTCVTNFSDLSLSNTPSHEREPTDLFTVAYVGTLGKANHLSYLIDLAEEAQKRGLRNFRCILMGEGAEEPLLKKRIAEKGLFNVSLLPHSSKEAAISVLKTASMAYLSFGPYDKLWTGSPNKYFDALAIGKPILCNFGGWIGDEITDKKCGVVYSPFNPQSFFDKHWPSLQAEDTLESMGQNALTLAKRSYSLNKQIPKWLTFLGR
ncbi:MAG: glycosyltransferase family 4 protein [Imperialibacter sp.]|uniref:glycosyltransferase family 4 protein n=1 Tax=Imperialibacter sp. TaxID=2038411 RepID=UPI003A883C63